MMHRVLVIGCVIAAVSGLPCGQCRAGDVQLSSELVVSGLISPTWASVAPGDNQRIFVLEKRGVVRLIKDGALQAEPFLNIDAVVPNEPFNGLLGLAFDPSYESNGYFYVQHPMGPAASNRLTVARYQVTDDPDVADADSRHTILELNYPSLPGHHVGGWIGFGPDGYLYVPLGDGGTTGQEVPGGQRAQSYDSYWGKILRIDPNADDYPRDPNFNFAVPSDNPYIGLGSVEAAWARGVRNPFRASFDQLTGDFWIGDVGLFQREEIDVVPAFNTSGLNFGWDCAEGTVCRVSAACTCPSEMIVDPIHDYNHALGCTITGGFVYRDGLIPDLNGAYIYGDYCSGRTWTLRYDGSKVLELIERTDELTPAGPFSIDSPVAYVEDSNGEILIVDHDGQIFRVGSSEPTPDIDGDGVVGPADLALLLGSWGSSPGDPADFDGNGTVGPADLALLLGAWGPLG